MPREFKTTMKIDLQPTLQNETVILQPLQGEDFQDLYSAASDPKVWEQHPNKNRWQKEVFKTFFEGAMQSKGAFKIVEKATGTTIGSSRFYDYNAAEKSIFIGYTFYATSCWGKGINPAVKTLMLDYILQFVSVVYFHVGKNNIRSVMAMDKLGAERIGEEEVAYFGEKNELNVVYKIDKENWSRLHEKN